ncbi:hypothetical protein HELRODRAFT_179787 [Helobdella robusta]|uniref:Uncharacterized protein n=1 Tax=Helobdella robusta TaxID=6412 RepID=T1FF57_HELRO|nr:hypothetical protein HELRODRAFT_179787 [Helobdella robusta]ESN95187.1 hypothetical protein HELRODRAFT_179787 [Helobdella robusta]
MADEKQDIITCCVCDSRPTIAEENIPKDCFMESRITYCTQCYATILFYENGSSENFVNRLVLRSALNFVSNREVVREGGRVLEKRAKKSIRRFSKDLKHKSPNNKTEIGFYRKCISYYEGKDYKRSWDSFRGFTMESLFSGNEGNCGTGSELF